MKLPTRYQFWSDVHEATEPFIVMGIFSAIILLFTMILFGVR